MPEYIVRARKAPTDAESFVKAIGSEVRVEYLAQIMTNCLFVSKGHRSDTKLTLVLEDSRDFSRAVSLDGDSMGCLYDQTESGMLKVIIESLTAASNLSKEDNLTLDNGIAVQAISFEHLVKVRLETHPVYLLDKKGEDIRSVTLADDAVFLLTDHIPMPRKTYKSLRRQGVNNLSLGPIMLHASQCVVLIQNEYDRQF